MEQEFNYDVIDEYEALTDFLDALAENFEDALDADGTKYNLALDFITERNVKSDDIKGLDKMMELINNQQDYLNDKLDKAMESNDEDEIKRIFDEVSYYQCLSIGILSMMIDIRNENIWS